MLKQVLSIRTAVFHLTDYSYQFRMKSVYSQIAGSALTCFDNLIVKLLLYLLNHFLDTSRVNSSVGHKLMECQSAYLTSYWVKSTDYNSLRSVVYYNFNTGSCLQRPDVSSFATNDSSFHFIVVNMEDTDAVFYSSLSSYALYCLDYDLSGLCVCVKLGLVHNLVDVALCISTGFVLQRLYKTLLSLFCTESREFFKLLTFLKLHFLQFLMLDGEHFLLVLNTCLLIVELILSASEVFLALIKRKLPLFQPVFTLLDMLVSHLHFLFQLTFLV